MVFLPVFILWLSCCRGLEATEIYEEKNIGPHLFLRPGEPLYLSLTLAVPCIIIQFK